MAEPLLRVAGQATGCRQNAVALAIIFAILVGALLILGDEAARSTLWPLVPIAVVVAVVAGTHRASRSGTVEFFADRIVIDRGDPDVDKVLRWDELAGFRDGSPDYVQLVPAKLDLVTPSYALRIPTLDAEARARVLQLLFQRGIPRIDANG